MDVRDMADGIIRCTERGKCGEAYILSNKYITVKRMFDIFGRVSGKRKIWGTVPLKVVRWVSPLCEKVENAIGIPLLATPYSTYTLGSNGDFSHEKAEKELGYLARPIEETLADVAFWIQKGK